MPNFLSKTLKQILAIAVFFVPAKILAQSSRINESNFTGWGTINLDWNLNKKWGIHLDLNQRRVNLSERIYQHLYRTGMNYKPNDKLYFRAGYVMARTSPFGDHQLASVHQTSTEHRSYEMVTFSEKSGNLETSHRLGFEQRWNSRFSSPALTSHDSWSYTNRARYRLRFDYSFKKNSNQPAYPYVFIYDEVMLNFGKQVTDNVFDQNRTGFFTGYTFSKITKLEFGFMYQIFQASKKFENKSVFQNNRNLLINLMINIPSGKAS